MSSYLCEEGGAPAFTAQNNVSKPNIFNILKNRFRSKLDLNLFHSPMEQLPRFFHQMLFLFTY